MAYRTSSTQDAEKTAWVESKDWKKGAILEGVVQRVFKTDKGDCFVVSAAKPFPVKGKPEATVACGLAAGMKMALNALGTDNFQVGDRILIECIGQTATKKGNPRKDFTVGLDRKAF